MKTNSNNLEDMLQGIDPEYYSHNTNLSVVELLEKLNRNSSVITSEATHIKDSLFKLSNLYSELNHACKDWDKGKGISEEDKLDFNSYSVDKDSRQYYGGNLEEVLTILQWLANIQGYCEDMKALLKVTNSKICKQQAFMYKLFTN